MSQDSDSDIGPAVLSLITRLARLARRYGVPASDCEDCIQEALLAWLRKHPDRSPAEPGMMRWLRVVLVNQARLYHRRLHRHRTRLIDHLDSIPSRDAPVETKQETDQTQSAARLTVIRDALSRLSDLNRAVVIRAVERRLTYREIGEELGLSPESVRLRYLRTLEKLRNQCNGESTQDVVDVGGGE
jgi:RNA polymerase sigma factor (sigma-70 family)